MAPLLTLLDFNATFTAEADACNTGIGAVLNQGGRFIAYFIKALGPKHQALPIYEKEMLAILATKRHYKCNCQCLVKMPTSFMPGERPRDWVKWLPLAEWWFKTTYHIATHVTPYEIVYGQPLPTHYPYLTGDSNVAAVDKSLKAREATIKMF
ncbi:Transposon Ty3-G Gag-Pol polyprotein [Gossypium australe]|uniref:Transposon Ty3-G Gag-Pol polyprotein n=1 Tax=Gossypium australe TaxID=47621 RepID=A0A5B6WSS3_9ROSI|nr:Transposon Ty3-G Gag-Pol polyprotein [Gossypium australe]